MKNLYNFFDLIVSKDKMEAMIIVKKKRDEAEEITKNEVLLFFNEFGIKYGIVEDALESIINNEENSSIVIAIGKQPIAGNDAYLSVKLLENTKESKGNLNFIDLRQVITIPSVQIGELIGEKIPSTKGEAGIDVFGEEVQAKDGKDFILRAGKNTRIGDDQLSIFATIDGQLCMESKLLHVYPLFEVNGDIDMGIGNIDFVGNVTVHGNVPSGFAIKAKGDIRIFGTVEAATLSSNGSIYVSAGVVAQGAGKIVATQQLYTNFINQANIEVQGDIHVSQAILHSNCYVGGAIYCHKGKGLIVGGNVSAGKAIFAKEIGNPMQTPTSLFVGVSIMLLQREDELIQKVNQGKLEIEKLEKLIQVYQAKEEKGIGLTTRERIMKLRVRKTLMESKEIFELAKEELEELKGLLNLKNTDGIYVENSIHPNVDIHFGKYRRKIITKYQGIKIQLLASEIQINTL